jgi:hypothetical protein
MGDNGTSQGGLMLDDWNESINHDREKKMEEEEEEEGRC